MNISIDYDKIKESYSNKKLLKKLIIGSAITLTLSPLLLKNTINNNAKLLLASSGFIFSMCCLKLPSTEYEEKLIQTYKNTHLKQYKTAIQGEIVVMQSELEIYNQQRLARNIEDLPIHQVPYFASKYGVVPLIGSNNNTNNYVEDNNNNNEPLELEVQGSLFENIIKKTETQEGVDLSWMTKAINSSVFLSGKKRSGKTYLMKWILKAYIAKCREQDTFYISDPHYDDVDYDDPWVAKEIDKKLITNGRLVKNQERTLDMINTLLGVIAQRKKQGLTIKKGVGLIRIFMDEVDSYPSDIQDQISNFIKIVEYEAAKFGVTVCIGAHSIKKGEMGIDSSVISSMLNILFPSVVLDRNSVLSGSFPTLPKLKNMIDSYKNTSLPSDGRLVVIADDSDVYVSHVPKLDLAIIKISNDPDNNDENNPIAKIKKWCDLCFATYQKYPTQEQIKTAWLEHTKQELSDDALNLLLEKLGIRHNNKP